MQDSQIVGRGWAFPITVSQTGGIGLVSGETELEQAMHLILGTDPGERPMRPEFGCRLNDFIFAPADATTAGLVAYEVRVALERWEPRVTIDDVEVTPDPDEPSTLWIDVTYTIRETYDRRSLVFPFYVIPEEAPAS
jgi:phage baseplate assembly protein W